MASGSVVILTLLYGIMVCWAQSPSANTTEDTQERVYFMKKCGGAGCPYTASWLAHINLYRKIPWWLDSTKMEAASFNIFDRAKLKFQMSDPETYYVHHMSMFEHLNHKKYGFEVAKNKTLIMSKAAVAGECDHLQPSRTKEYISLIPFYGGLPPGVTKDLTVKSIGQGNSLVDSFTKGLQTMATVCSCLKYYGRVIIGVARDEDRILVNDMLHQKLSAEARHHVNVVQFQMGKPAHLPFHLLAWGQQYVRVYNCHPYYINPDGHSNGTDVSSLPSAASAAGGAHTEGNATANSTSTSAASSNHGASGGAAGEATGGAAGSRGGATLAQLALFSPDSIPAVDAARLPKSDLYDICWPGAIVSSHQGPLKPVYLKKFDIGRHRVSRHDALAHSVHNSSAVSGSAGTASDHAHSAGVRHGPQPIKYVYFTESDQIVHYDSVETLHALSAASNDTTFFVGKRREKARDSEPTDYMGTLSQWRECGTPGYSLTWPKESVVRID